MTHPRAQTDMEPANATAAEAFREMLEKLAGDTELDARCAICGVKLEMYRRRASKQWAMYHPVKWPVCEWATHHWRGASFVEMTDEQARKEAARIGREEHPRPRFTPSQTKHQ